MLWVSVPGHTLDARSTCVTSDPTAASLHNVRQLHYTPSNAQWVIHSCWVGLNMVIWWCRNMKTYSVMAHLTTHADWWCTLIIPVCVCVCLSRTELLRLPLRTQARLSSAAPLSIYTVCLWRSSPKIWFMTSLYMCWKWSRAARGEDVGEWGEKGWDCWRHGVPSPAVCGHSLSCRPRVRGTCTENTRAVSKSRADRFQACLSCVVVKIGGSPNNTAAAAEAEDTLEEDWRNFSMPLSHSLTLLFDRNFKVECFLSSSPGHVYDSMSEINPVTLNVINDVFFMSSLYTLIMNTPWMHCFSSLGEKKVPGSTTLRPQTKTKSELTKKKGDWG